MLYINQRHLTSDSGQPASSFYSSYACELWCVCVPTYRSVPVYFNTEFNFTGLFFGSVFIHYLYQGNR